MYHRVHPPVYVPGTSRGKRDEVGQTMTSTDRRCHRCANPAIKKSLLVCLIGTIKERMRASIFDQPRTQGPPRCCLRRPRNNNARTRPGNSGDEVPCCASPGTARCFHYYVLAWPGRPPRIHAKLKSWKCSEVKLYFSPSAGGLKKEKKKKRRAKRT